MNLSTPIEQLPHIGPFFQRKLKKLGIKTVHDLVYHFPHRYEDFSETTPISKISLTNDQTYCIQGKILEIGNNRTWKRKMTITQAIVQDKTGAIKVIWFNQPYLLKSIKSGDMVSLIGKVKYGKEAYLSSPAYEKISEKESLLFGRIIPVYPETEKVSSKWLRFIIRPVLAELKDIISDPLPKEIIKEFNLWPLSKAIHQVHFPDSFSSAKKAQERFSFENLFYIELVVFQQRMKMGILKSFPVPLNLKTVQRFVKSLPFKLTDPQKKSAWQILKDLEKSRPMNRLLEGDVGSGKTVVAAIAALNAAKAGFQTAFMAPTEVLAKQHFKTVWSLLKDYKLDLGIITGKEDKFYSKKLKSDSIEISRKKLIERAGEGKIDILIGTHALITGKMKFKNLALVIVDEQHRFGVEQRAKLQAQSTDKVPHLLSMTATPIPRTLALTIYGDLDLSLIDVLPKGRKDIITEVAYSKDRKRIYDFIRKEIKKGRQAFIICPRIESKEKENSTWNDVKAVKKEHERLSKEIFPNFNVALLHGKIASKEKERIMNSFKNKKADILVSTSVIEVGVDIQNASVIIIEGAERFGLAQLHQFRGRVGRSKYQSYCFLFTTSDSSANQRLKALVNCQSGFKLAEKDLQIRGPGEFKGTRQWGIPDITMESLKDIPLIEKTRTAAKELLEKDPQLKTHPLLLEKVRKFQQKIHLE